MWIKNTPGSWETLGDRRFHQGGGTLRTRIFNWLKSSLRLLLGTTYSNPLIRATQEGLVFATDGSDFARCADGFQTYSLRNSSLFFFYVSVLTELFEKNIGWIGNKRFVGGKKLGGINPFAAPSKGWVFSMGNSYYFKEEKNWSSGSLDLICADYWIWFQLRTSSACICEIITTAFFCSENGNCIGTRVFFNQYS